MKLTQLFAPTLKEEPKEAEVVSHKLLLRAGYVRKLAAGIYDFLPLGIRSLRKIEAIVRDEMDRAGAQEVLLPVVQPAEIWQESGRWAYYGSELLRMKDRKGGDFCLGPTHEEVITHLVRGEIRSYRQLPLNLYQIQAKFRDEVRPRAGLMRGREFIMKDAYSFHATLECAHEQYWIMYRTYERIFRRCGLKFRAVEADTGNIGGNLSHEFQVLAETGEDSIVSCPVCGYTANIEKAEIRVERATAPRGPRQELAKVETPAKKAVADVAKFLGVTEAQIAKTLIFIADGAPVAVVIRGDHEVNEVKVKAFLGATTIGLATDANVFDTTGAPVGFAGPVGLKCRVIADFGVEFGEGLVCGANAKDLHYTGLSVERDLPGIEFGDFRLAGGGDPCGRCGGAFEFFRGIEVGQVFYLGTKYSKAMGATILNEKGEETPMQMGCYGVGVSRILAAAIEQNHDENGIVWPMALAPYHVIVSPLQIADEPVMMAARSIYEQLRAAGVDVLLDDRDQRPGVKFKDADLFGIPVRVTVGARGLEKGEVEVKHRRAAQATLMPLGEVVEALRKMVSDELAAGVDG
jgi:prolyl-tRNA synthetase